jgi:hypothetical protein
MRKSRVSLPFLKVLHTLVWAIMTIANLMAFYFAFIGRFDLWFWIPATLLAIEIAVMLSNHMKCPLTNAIEKQTNDRSANFGIYLPGWMAKYNVRIYAILLPIEALIVIIKQLAWPNAS